MTSLPEQLSAASTRQISAQLDAQFRFFNTLATQALDSASRLVSLNLSTSRDSVERSSHTIRQLVQATQPRDLLVLRSHAEEQVRSLFDYGRELFNITANAQPYGLRTIAPSIAPVTLAAPLVKQVVEATEDLVQQSASTVARSFESATEAATEASNAATEAVTDAVTGSATEAVTEAAEPVAQVATPEPVAFEEAPGAAAEAQARVEQEPEPVARQKQIAKAASGKGASKAAVPAQPLAAPVEEQEAASVTRIETPSKRRK